MSRVCICGALIVFGLVLKGSVPAAGQTPPENPALLALYQQLRAVMPGDTAYLVEDSLTLTFPDLHLRLEKGTLLQLVAAGTVPAGIVFSGKGRAFFKPRHGIERRQLARFTEKETLQADFDYLAIRGFAQVPALHHLRRRPAGESERRRLASFARDVQKSVLQKSGYNLPARLLSEYIFGSNRYIACYFRTIREERNYSPYYIYTFEPYSREKIALRQYRPRALGKPFYTLSSYPPGNYFGPAPNPSVEIRHYEARIDVQKKGRLHISLQATLHSRGNLSRTLYFQLATGLNVDSVLTSGGEKLDFIREAEESGLTLLLPEKLLTAQDLVLHFYYRGAALAREPNGTWLLKEPLLWHPRIGYLQRATYTLHFRHPADIQVLSQGEFAEERIDAETKETTFAFGRPAHACTFIFGRFKPHFLSGPGGTVFEVYAAPFRTTKSLTGLNRDLAGSMYMFTTKLMPLVPGPIRIIESQRLQSQSFPGFIRLSSFALQTGAGGSIGSLRSHEVAHQWWGNLLGWRTYHDQWLSEGFAEYMGALYLAFAFPNSGQFSQLITAWRDDLLSAGNVGVGLGLKRFGFSKEALKNSDIERAGPVYLGQRLGQKVGAEYYLLVYEKGAYILHMLRRYLIDDHTGSDARFWQLLRTFLATYAGRAASSMDFIRSVAKSAGEDLTWFFDQWLFASAIPAYKFTHRVDGTAADGYYLRGTATQEGGGAAFRSFVPVEISFPGGRVARERLLFNGHQHAFEFGPYPERPEKVEFNPDHAILARSK